MKRMAVRTRKPKKNLALLIGIIQLLGCGIPNSPAIPASPISIDNNDADNRLAFLTPADARIDRYIIWYKIYPYLDRTNTENLVNTDYDYFNDLNLRSSSDIRRRDFHELQLSSEPNANFYLQGIGAGVTVSLIKNPANHVDYITAIVAGGASYKVRRNVPISSVDNLRKAFYDSFDRTSDADIRNRSNDFSAYGPLDEGFALAFLAQSAYIDPEELEVITSELATLGIIFSTVGFTN